MTLRLHDHDHQKKGDSGGIRGRALSLAGLGARLRLIGKRALHHQLIKAKIRAAARRTCPPD